MSTAAGTVRARGAAACPPVSLQSTVRQVVNELAALITQRRAVIEIGRTAEDPQVRGPEPAVKQIVYHLIRNAVEASSDCGVVRISQHEHDGQVILEVTDEGPGIHCGDFSKIFKRGFTTKSGCKGQGLAEVEWRLAELRGVISWESPLRTGKGTCFTVTLPAAPPVQAVQASRVPA
jgi:signal transduction histidine kinase